MIERIAVLTSGGDAPGMNACVRAVIRCAISKGIKPYVVFNGYKGLIDEEIQEVDKKFTQDIINRGGTIIKTARLPEFKEIEVQKKAIEVLKKWKIDGLVGIGGDGTYRGLLSLSKLGFPVVGIPGTIDNDIASTDETIGFDTALNTICDCVDKLKDTSSSHQRCSVIEVMGRHCGDLALYSGIAEGAEFTLTPDHTYNPEDAKERLKVLHDQEKSHAILIVSEHLVDSNELAQAIEKYTGFESRAEILGRLQRGGIPTARDRILASRFGCAAVELLCMNLSGRVVGLKKNHVVDFPINQALEMERDIHKDLLSIIDTLA